MCAIYDVCNRSPPNRETAKKNCNFLAIYRMNHLRPATRITPTVLEMKKMFHMKMERFQRDGTQFDTAQLDTSHSQRLRLQSS
ncbi:hypothetical protein ALC57_11025 [Trachymyrmex cornetzi]|uniref:Uncharacterized protein n=1 Tax=Trachymyrmex cornetzi TaxID=471704 RepID=A0A151J2Z2_9HYME|nr:hypothetical protein ALC57_11025 [Trachymyrmex cornetzi]